MQPHSFFCSLREIHLRNMQNLKSICKKSLWFPALKQVYMENCPNVEKLQLEVNSASGFEILALDECSAKVKIILVKE